MIHLVLFICLLNFVSSENIIAVSPVTTKNVSETVELFCKVRNWTLGDNDITWYKQKSSGSTVLAYGNATLYKDSRFSVKIDYSASPVISTLRIDKLRADDSGVYRCTFEPENKDITLQIRSPPFIYGNTTQSFNTSLHENVTFECYGGGYPTPEVTWTRDNNGALPNGSKSFQGSILKIQNVTKDHAGNYYCTVDNKVGENAIKTFRLDVDFPPIVKAHQQRVGQALKYVTQLECLVESSKTPIVTWHRDNLPIADNQYYSRTQSAINDQVTSFVLKVHVEEKKVYGTYTCSASNSFGKNSAQIELYQTEKEVCSLNCSTNSGHSIINMLELKLSFTGVIILMLNWQM